MTDGSSAYHTYLKDTLKSPLLHLALVFIAGASFSKLKEFVTRLIKKPTRGEQRATEDAKALKKLQKILGAKEVSKMKGRELSSATGNHEDPSESHTPEKTLAKNTEISLGEQ